MAKFAIMDGSKLLADHIARNYASQAEFARVAKCSEPHLSLYLKGSAELSPKMAKKLSAATNGQVPAAVLLGLVGEAAE